jgi:hypothetical protein
MQNPDQNPDDALATETIEHRRQVEAADARFRATLRRALRSGEETLQGCVGRHERLRNRNGGIPNVSISSSEGALKR